MTLAKSEQGSLLELILKHTLKLILAGTIIGVFHRYDLYVAVFLLLYLLYTLYRKFNANDPEKWIYLIGIGLTSILGIICEKWGIHNQYWSYHNLDNNREFPYWLPVAWGLAFGYIYRIEREIILIKNIKSIYSKTLLALGIAIFFPTVGEVVVINLGAWTYHWPLQILGVPILAMFLLMVFHTGINFLLMAICRKFKISDVVFSAK
ncbi:MAG TPA: hypothetical protein VKX33_01075 [Cyclobacteriaceae bacterium]|nr:hypothetical protein [Cyclobacteriaceae bacterium]